MGIRASYWATGGILTVLGVALAQLILPLLAGMALAVGAFLLKAALVMVAIMGVALALAVARRTRDRRRAAES